MGKSLKLLRTTFFEKLPFYQKGVEKLCEKRPGDPGFWPFFTHVSAENEPDLAENVTRTPNKAGRHSLNTFLSVEKF